MHEESSDDMTSDADGTIGWRNNKATRQDALTLTKRAIREGMVKLNSIPCILECQSFVKTVTGKVEADTGKHDDRVLAVMIGLYCLDQMPELASIYYPQEDVSNYYKFVQRYQAPKRRSKSGYGR